MVNDIPAGDGKIDQLFLQCTLGIQPSDTTLNCLFLGGVHQDTDPTHNFFQDLNTQVQFIYSFHVLLGGNPFSRISKLHRLTFYYLLTSSFRKKALQEGRRFELETCDAGMQNCQKILLSEKSQVNQNSSSIK